MTTVVLLVLAIVWGALLVSWLRSRTEGTFSDSVGTFRRHLSVLERTGPHTMPAANRMRSGFVAGRAPAPGRPLGARGAVGVGGSRSLRPPSAAVLRRRQVQKRRRDVFFALLAGVIGSFALALIPGLQVMWFIQVVFDLLFVAYVGLLLHLRNLAAERELKLTFLSRAPVRSGPSRGGGYALAGYDDLALRHTAN